ncbi:hypothetical protein [Cylindrospermum sp. FACHB-282]|uniref:hypothetical protein n=1 Tax=Cylindrospermum sp. FACHB-282 TaxID=2692794 RepID=UPI001685BD12|nr:hypothetical protein [Cylindrospermum sp. FACHB-282]MBD2386604.1 hypothetical protein [Cylindrospermum sp. FACHB-282]
MSGNHSQNLFKMLASLVGVASTSALLTLPVLALPNSSSSTIKTSQIPASRTLHSQTRQPINATTPGTQPLPNDRTIRTQQFPPDTTTPGTQQFPPDTTAPGTQQFPPDTTAPGTQQTPSVENRRRRQNNGQGIRGLW